MKTLEILKPAKLGNQTVLQATNKEGKLLGLYFDAQTRLIPNNSEWTITEETDESNAIVKDILDSFEGCGVFAKYRNGVLIAKV